MTYQPKDKGEIEITPEMIKAGAQKLVLMDDEAFSHASDERIESIVSEVFWAMLAAFRA